MSTIEHDLWNLPPYDQWEDTGERWATAFGEAHKMRIRHKEKPSVSQIIGSDGSVIGCGTSMGFPAGWTEQWVVDPLGSSPIPLQRETCPYCGLDYVANDADLKSLIERLDGTLSNMMSSYDEVALCEGCMGCLSQIEAKTVDLRAFLSAMAP